MACSALTLMSWLAVAVAPSSGVSISVLLAGGVHSSGDFLDEKHTALVRERPMFAVYALINNVACERCGTSKSFLEEARKCLPKSVNLKTPVCMREEQYLKEYGENAPGVLKCYQEVLSMKADQLQCLLEANHLEESPHYDINQATEQQTTDTWHPHVSTDEKKPISEDTDADTTYSRDGIADQFSADTTTDASARFNYDYDYKSPQPWTPYTYGTTTTRYWAEVLLRELLSRGTQKTTIYTPPTEYDYYYYNGNSYQ